MGESWGRQRSVFGAPGEGPRVFFTGNLEPPGAHLLEKMIVCRARGCKSSVFCRKARSGGLQGTVSPEKVKITNARTSPRPRGYVAKLENLEKVRGQGCPMRFGYEGYVAKRRNGQRVHG